MPANKKGNVNWERIERRYKREYRATPKKIALRELGRQEGVSFQAIQDRAKARGWDKDLTGGPTSEATSNHLSLVHDADNAPEPGTRKKTPARIDAILSEIREHRRSPAIAAQLHGVQYRTLREWAEKDEGLKRAIADAEAPKLAAVEDVVMTDIIDGKNSGLGFKYLERHEATRETYGNPANGNGRGNVMASFTLNIPTPGTLSNFDEALAWHNGTVSNPRPLTSAPAIREGTHYTPDGWRCTAEVAAYERGWRPDCGLTHEQFIDRWMRDHANPQTIDVTPGRPNATA